MSGQWTFLCHAVNARSGTAWLEVFGGKAHHETMHAFRLGEVIPRK